MSIDWDAYGGAGASLSSIDVGVSVMEKSTSNVETTHLGEMTKIAPTGDAQVALDQMRKRTVDEARREIGFREMNNSLLSPEISHLVEAISPLRDAQVGPALTQGSKRTVDEDEVGSDSVLRLIRDHLLGEEFYLNELEFHFEIAPMGPALSHERKQTVEEVWKESDVVEDVLVEPGAVLEEATGIVPVERELREKMHKTIEEMTLEEFLVRAGVVREEASTVLAARREVKVSVEEFLVRAGAGVVPEEAARIRQGLEERKSDRMGGNKMTVAKGLRQRRMIKNRESAARSRELKQSMAVTVMLEEENQQQAKEKDKKSAKQIVAATSLPGIGSSLSGDRSGSSRTSAVKRLHASYEQSIKENGRAKQNVGATSSSRAIVLQPDSSSQQLRTEIDDINGVNVVCIGPDDTNISKKQSKVWTLDREYGISRNVLEQHFGKKLEDVADILGVSRSTLKRICRKHDISRWPPSRAKKFKSSLTHQEFVQATEDNVKEFTEKNQPLYNLPLEKYSDSNAQTRSNAAQVVDDSSSSIMVKATHRGDMIKFQLSVSSRRLDLEEEVAMRLRLSVGSFKIKYLDEDDDWVLITCDADLRTCISTLGSVGKTEIKMLVEQM